jgi:hypothetical protein
MDEEQLIATWMARVAAAPLPAAQIPEAAAIWWQAQLERERDARRRAQRPIELMEWIQLGAAAAAAVAVFVQAIPAFTTLIHTFATATH